MREKLQLLSRIIFSPPNPRVSGGFPLHHGGSLLHHGGPFLSHGGPYPSFSPHRFGFTADHQASFYRLLLLSTVTPLPQIPKTLSPSFTTKPPPTLRHPSSSTSAAWSRRQRSDLPSQLRRSLTGSLFHSRFITVPMTAPSRARATSIKENQRVDRQFPSRSLVFVHHQHFIADKTPATIISSRLEPKVRL